MFNKADKLYQATEASKVAANYFPSTRLARNWGESKLCIIEANLRLNAWSFNYKESFTRLNEKASKETNKCNNPYQSLRAWEGEQKGPRLVLISSPGRYPHEMFSGLFLISFNFVFS